MANYPLASDIPSLNCYQSSALPGAPKSLSQSPVVPNIVQTEMNSPCPGDIISLSSDFSYTLNTRLNGI